MTRLNKHKESTRLASGSGDSSMTAAERRERVQQLLMERQTRLSSEGTARKGGSAAGGSIGRHSTPTRGARGGVDVRTGFFRIRVHRRRFAPRVVQDAGPRGHRDVRAPVVRAEGVEPADGPAALQPEREEGGTALQGSRRGEDRGGGGEGFDVQAADANRADGPRPPARSLAAGRTASRACPRRGPSSGRSASRRRSGWRANATAWTSARLSPSS
jgi:hypothetical protein